MTRVNRCGALRRSPAAVLVPIALTGLLLAGCTAGGAGSATSGSAGGADSAAAEDRSGPQSFTDAASGGSGGGSSAEAASAAAPAAGSAGSDLAGAGDRQVVTTGSASIVVGSPAQAAEQIAVYVEGAGGRVEQRSVQTPEEGPASATLTVRVPAEGFSGTLEQLGRFGEVSDVDVTSTDVTAQASDLDARVAALRTSTERLTALLAGAASTEEVVAAESALTQRQAELDSLTAQRAVLSGQVEMATLSLFVSGRAEAPVVEAGGFLGGLASGWNALVAAVAGALVVFGVVLPWLVAAALVVAAAAGAARVVRRVQARRTTATSTVTGADEES